MAGPPRRECTSCRAEVYFATTPAGKRAILDRHPVPEGNVVSATTPEGIRLAVTLSSTALELARARGEKLYISHWATCPNREHHASVRDRKAAHRG